MVSRGYSGNWVWPLISPLKIQSAHRNSLEVYVSWVSMASSWQEIHSTFYHYQFHEHQASNDLYGFQLIWEAWIKSVDVVYILWNKWKYNHAQWIVFHFSFWILTVNTSKHDGFFRLVYWYWKWTVFYLFINFLGSNWQILAYLLVSASSSAATRVDDWQSNWGKDEFTEMATASVVMAFLAFIAYAGSSIISGYNLYNRDAIWWHSHIIFKVMEKEKWKSHMQFFLFNVV